MTDSADAVGDGGKWATEAPKLLWRQSDGLADYIGGRRNVCCNNEVSNIIFFLHLGGHGPVGPHLNLPMTPGVRASSITVATGLIVGSYCKQKIYVDSTFVAVQI